MGWRVEEERTSVKVLRSEDGRQRATISVMQVSPDASEVDFERICRARIEAEKKELSDGFVEPGSPFSHAGRFEMFFYGGDAQSHRVCSGYFSLEAGELITIFVEGVGVDAPEHLECFRSFASGLER